MACPWARHFTLKCFTRFRCKWVPGRIEITIRTIRSMRWKNGTISAQLKWHTKEHVQWPDGAMWNRLMSIQSWYDNIDLHLLRTCLKMKMLTQYPASNDIKHIIFKICTSSTIDFWYKLSHSDLRDYISDTTRSYPRMHAWRLTRFISR